MRWIFGSSVDVVRAWVRSGMEENVLINISRANIKCEIPERAAIDMLAYHTNTRKMGVCSAVQVMYRHFAEACEKVFREEGDEALSLFIEKEHVGFVGDWLKAQGRADGQLSKGHGEELIQTREVFDLVFASMICHTAAKRAQWQVEHELRKYELALVHDGLGRKPAKNRQSDAPGRSNRDQTQTPNSTTNSLTYDVPM